MSLQTQVVETATHDGIKQVLWMKAKSKQGSSRHKKIDIISTKDKAWNIDDMGMVRVEINAAMLLQLLKGRRLCAADMRCLDCESKRCLLRLLLKACAQEIANDGPLNFNLKGTN
jgi:hypothetical protein